MPDQAHPASDDTVAEEVPDDLAPQVPVIVDALAALGIARLGADGFEADDVIGTLATRWGGTMAVDIVTGDRDLLQLVDDARGVRVIYTARGGVRDPDLVDQAFLRTKYAVANGPAYADMAVLRGDTSDGLPASRASARRPRRSSSRSTARSSPCARPSTPATRRSRVRSGPGSRRARPTRRGSEGGAGGPDAPVAEVNMPLPSEVADPVLMSRIASEFGVTSSFNRVLSALRIE